MLIFNSNFECGNLATVIPKSNTEYNLYISSDTNATYLSQWFYFSVSNTCKGSTIRFNVMNLTKYPFFAKDGMKPFVFSEIDYAEKSLSWSDNNINNIAVTKSSMSAFNVCGNRPINLSGQSNDSLKSFTRTYYMLSFSYTFNHGNDTVYFSFFKPYSYTRMLNFLDNIVVDCSVSYKREVLCYSLLGIPVDLLTITSQKPIQKTYVVITARMHASETAGSFKVQGIIEFLLSQHPIAISLRHHHIFLIVPLLNVDGVVLGNNRHSLAGYDMNRCWGNPIKKLQPEIFHLKEKLSEINRAGGNQILMYCDLHGHSRYYNSFLFACHKGTFGTLCSWTQSRLLTRILARQCHILNYHQCSFKVEPEKNNTARVIIWKEFKVVNSFTLESSQYGYMVGNKLEKFTEKAYTELAHSFMSALNEYKKLLKELHNELSGQNNWLRPCHLQELAGIPAADLIKKGAKGKISEEASEEKAMMKYSNQTKAKSVLGTHLKKIKVSHLTHTVKPTTSWKDYFPEVEFNMLKTENTKNQQRVKPKAALLITNSKEVNEKTMRVKKHLQLLPLKLSPVIVTETKVDSNFITCCVYGSRQGQDFLNTSITSQVTKNLLKNGNKSPSVVIGGNRRKKSHIIVEEGGNKGAKKLAPLSYLNAYINKTIPQNNLNLMSLFHYTSYNNPRRCAYSVSKAKQFKGETATRINIESVINRANSFDYSSNLSYNKSGDRKKKKKPMREVLYHSIY